MFNNTELFKAAFIEQLVSRLGKSLEEATSGDVYQILGVLVRERIGRHWAQTNETYKKQQEKQVYYFSMEFLIGRLLGNNLLNLGVLDTVRDGLLDLGWDLQEIEEQEQEAGLGNGGLGRLAACFLDSLASLQYAGHGCGIRYKYGLFEQKIVDGHQVELPDNWLQKGYVWEERRADKRIEVSFWGRVEISEKNGRTIFKTADDEKIWAVPYDIPIIGCGRPHVNTLRLWSAESAVDPAKLRVHGEDGYYKFLDYNRSVESISEFLYPDDSRYEGKLLRLKQQYFLCAAGLQSVLRTFEKLGLPYSQLPCKVAIHINDTHPTLTIPELMRILIDEKGYGWDEAWDITIRTVSYTNHTLLSEALEKWPVQMVRELLPRVYMIIEEINKRFCGMLLERYPSQPDAVSQMAIIENDQVKMAHLAVVGSYSVNGVARLHTELLKQDVMKPFYELFPDRFNNKTNGITHRRWLLHANPELGAVISESIGTAWIESPHQLLELEPFKDDPAFRNKCMSIKRGNKLRLAEYIRQKQGTSVDPDSIFDVQVKRLHGYKRQLMNILHIMHLYNDIKDDPAAERVPRTFIFGAKAAPGYYLAKCIIKLIHVVADAVNKDPQMKGKLQVLFLENYSVSLAEKIIPAADVSEQISTAGKEASGTGNMKFMMNGALTIGTLDGANVEMHQLLGDDNIFLFGLRSEEVQDYYKYGGYLARDMYERDPRIKRIIDQLVSPGPFCCHELEFGVIRQSLLDHNDEFFVLRDFGDYAKTQAAVDRAYLNPQAWAAKSVINIARSGHFSSDRTIRLYASDIWKIQPVGRQLEG
ncbi:glycogen/starch/alpha-glucan phosphorylase [Paenibacillus donghaensis]|uniref:glycogen/starch/alpha-glucan phosphorylase n=1 Tax=Paenibacillus donghaensis TaxID=414771 RepID=UPI001883BCB1|nr:glycogen/starch/alpha-glucan phosphorylase [Paenibacillus donghaensis]MBE9916532.1 glycogen/starch/alpha-glucan phosphorylase [Paenibacillus donghaensis]